MIIYCILETILMSFHWFFIVVVRDKLLNIQWRRRREWERKSRTSNCTDLSIAINGDEFVGNILNFQTDDLKLIPIHARFFENDPPKIKFARIDSSCSILSILFFFFSFHWQCSPKWFIMAIATSIIMDDESSLMVIMARATTTHFPYFIFHNHLPLCTRQ